MTSLWQTKVFRANNEIGWKGRCLDQVCLRANSRGERHELVAVSGTTQIGEHFLENEPVVYGGRKHPLYVLHDERGGTETGQDVDVVLVEKVLGIFFWDVPGDSAVTSTSDQG